VDEINDRSDHREHRFNITGMVRGEVVTVTYTERDDRIRIISARKATRHEQDTYFSQDFSIAEPGSATRGKARAA
jgi:uncharacterized DUF497 family protein